MVFSVGQVGNSSKVKGEQILRCLIAEEHEKESFTVVVVTGIYSDHITFLKNYFDMCTRKLA